MITEEQRKLHCKNRLASKMLFATLTKDFKPQGLDYTLPAGTIVQLILFVKLNGYLFVNGKNAIDFNFPYDAAELLE